VHPVFAGTGVEFGGEAEGSYYYDGQQEGGSAAEMGDFFHKSI